MQRDDVLQFNDQGSMSLNFDGRASSTDPTGTNRPQHIRLLVRRLLMGRVATFSTVGILDYNIHTWSTFFFAQDEWKITPRLTLTPGLRYEFYQPAKEDNNRADAFVLGHQSDLYPNAPVDLAFAGDKGMPDGFAKNDWTNFAPRLGIAYDVTGNGKTVLRAGAGYYYSYNPLQIRLWSVEAPPWRPNANGGNTTSLVDIWGTSRSLVYPQPPTPFTTDVTQLHLPAEAEQHHRLRQQFQTPYSIQWNVTFEKEINKVVTASAGYVANRGLTCCRSCPGTCPCRRPMLRLNNIEQRRPLANYSNVGIIYSRARSWYDSLQLTANIRGAGTHSRVSLTSTESSTIWPRKTPRGTATSRPRIRRIGMASARTTATAICFARSTCTIFRSSRIRPVVADCAAGWQVSGSTSITSGDFLNVTLGTD